MTILRPRWRRRDGEVRPGDNPADQGKRRRRLSGDVLAGLPLVVPMAAGAVLSFGGQYEAAKPWFQPTELGALVPVAIDGAILACGVQWIYAARKGRRADGWRSATHFFVGLTIWLNYLSTPERPYLPLPEGEYEALSVGLHIGGAVVWAVLAELLARAMTRRHREEVGEADRIPLALWVTEFRESWRTKVRMWRTRETNATTARVEADRCELALVRLGRALSDEAYAADLDMFRRRLAAGSIRPLDVLDAIESSRVELSRVDGRVESSESSRVDPDALVDRCVELALASSRVEEQSTGEASRVELEESTRLAVESRPAPSPVVESTGVEAVDRPASPGVSGAGVARASLDAASGGVKPAVLKAADAIKAAQAADQLPQELEAIGAEPARKVIGASWATANQALKYLATQNGHSNGHRPA